MGGGNEEGAEAIPIAFAGRAGDDVVESNEDVIDGVDVGRLCGRSASEGIGAGLLGGTGRGFFLLSSRGRR